MRTSIICAGLGGLLALAGCDNMGKRGAGNEAAAEDRSAPAAAGVKLRPGQWETTVETLKMEAPGIPADALAMMGGQQKVTSRSCITAEQAERPSGDLFHGDKEGNCSGKDFSFANGRVSGTIACGGPNMAGKVTLEMDGRYGADSYDISQKMTTTGDGTSMKIESRVVGRRIGDCPAGTQG